MSDDIHLRCRTCCTAAMGGDATRVDDDVFRPFTGGVVNDANPVRYDDAVHGLRFAKSIQAVAQAFLVLKDAEEETLTETSYRQIACRLAMGGLSAPSIYDSYFDLDFFATHGSHDLVLHCFSDLDACSTCWFEHKRIQPKHPEHP